MRVSILHIAAASALILTSGPAFASAAQSAHQPTAPDRGAGPASDENIHNGYWSASSEYVVSDQKPTSSSAMRPVRRILISGYHPVQGFEGEIAKEKAAVAGATSNKAVSMLASADR